MGRNTNYGNGSIFNNFLGVNFGGKKRAAAPVYYVTWPDVPGYITITRSKKRGYNSKVERYFGVLGWQWTGADKPEYDPQWPYIDTSVCHTSEGIRSLLCRSQLSGASISRFRPEKKEVGS